MDHSQTMAWWQNQAPTYFTDKVFSFTRPDLIRRFSLTTDSVILEIGFGYGRELSQFCNLSANVHGLELFDCTCELAREELRKQNVTWMPQLQTYDGEHIPFEPGTFDFAYSCFVLQHMSRAAAKRMLGEIIRVLKPTGKALMEFFGDPKYHHPSEDRFSGDPAVDGMFNNAYTPGDIGALVDGVCSLVWVKPQKIYLTSTTFLNYWACFVP